MTQDKLIQICDNLIAKAKRTNKHYVLDIWVSPFNTFEHRVGYFETYPDAQEYMNMITSQITTYGLGIAHYIIIDGHYEKTIN